MSPIDELDLFYAATLTLPLLVAFLLLRLGRSRRRDESSSWPLLIGWNVAFFLFLASTAFAVGETWYRFFVDRTDAVGVMRIATRWHQRHYQYNEQGWRDNIGYELEPQASRRITFLGDSFTAGSGIKNVDDRFSNILRSRLPDTEIHVLARNGFNSGNHLKTVDYLLEMGYPTDAVVLIYMMNDIKCCMDSPEAFNRTMLRHSYSLGYLPRESYLLNTLYFRLKAKTSPKLNEYEATMHEAYVGQSWRRNLDLLREVRRRLDSSGIRLLVVTFPFLQDLRSYNFRQEHEKLDAFWVGEGVPHLDLLPFFLQHADQPLAVHKWDAHPNEYANRLAADVIQDFLAREQLIEAPTSQARSVASR